MGVMPKQTPDAIRDGMGTTWAVLIANSKYSLWPDLKGEPYKDIELIAASLGGYQFDRIIQEHDLAMDTFEPFLDNLYEEMIREQVRSLLIYYAGHGEYNELPDQGYWIPVDARLGNRVGYLRDDDIRRYVQLYNRQARHVVLLADCCFSGNILAFRARDQAPTLADVQNLQIDVSKTSAFGITSGRREERVQNRSKFSIALEDILTRNQSPYLRASDIAYHVCRMTIGQTDT